MAQWDHQNSNTLQVVKCKFIESKINNTFRIKKKMLNNIIKKKLVERAKVGHGSL